MDLGEKISVIANIIYSNAVQEFSRCGITESLAAVVMEGVFRRFQEEAYRKCLLHSLKKEMENNPEPERAEHTQPTAEGGGTSID